MPKVQQRWSIFFRPHLRQHPVLNAVTVVAETLSQAVDTPGANTATAGQSVDSEDSYYSAESCGAIAATDTQGYSCVLGQTQRKYPPCPGLWRQEVEGGVRKWRSVHS